MDGRIATDATTLVTPRMFATPEEQTIAVAAPGDAFLTVQQRINAGDKKREMEYESNINAISYRLGKARPETAQALLADLKNPDVTWDEITEKYQLNIDVSSPDIANEKNRYTNTSMIGTVRRPVQPQKKN